MIIGIVTHNVVKGDGQGRVNYEVVKAAVRRGYRVVLLASKVAPELAADAAITWIQFPVAGWPSELVRTQLFAWRSKRWLRAHRSELDLVLANGFITWTPADINAVHFVHHAWKRSKVHTARLTRGPYAWYQWLYTTWNAYGEKRAFAQAKVLIAVSDRVRDELIKIGVPVERIRVIPNGVDPQEFSPGPGNRAALGLPEDVPLGVFVGDARTPRKNLDTILKAMQEAPGLHLVVVGGTEGSPYPRLAGQLGVGDRVHFLGYRQDIPEIMRAADLCLCPSRHEPFSLVLLEALATGIPVITARTVGATQLIDADSGIVIDDPEDSRALARALNVLTGDADLREKMGRAGRHVAERHCWSSMAQQYLHLFEELSSAAWCAADGLLDDVSKLDSQG